jgi:DNA-binding NtrC family response regulator
LAARDSNWQRLIAWLAEIEICVPPLSARREDIPVLVQHFLAAYCHHLDRALLKFAPSAMELLEGYSWPRNLRELESAVNEAVDQAELTSVLDESHLPVEIRSFPSSIHDANAAAVQPINLDELLEEVERTVIGRAISMSPRNRAQAARWLGISRSRLLRRISQLGLDGDQNRSLKMGSDPV